ncbi:MAG TPA: coniferyl aldehyde dehydrogenase [Bryobacteraceae bacterium]|nr:coniferyl aldehyde dehydrogenase [Bryobacteraceae bacterium]
MSTASPAPLTNPEISFALQREAFSADPFPSARERRTRLDRLMRAIKSQQTEIESAIDRDFAGRSRTEVRYSEILVSLQSLRHAKRNVGEWMKSRPVHVDLTLQMARAWVMPQPVGVVGIVVPWNYPLFLTMGPLAGALAAGNRVMLKLSEFAPFTSCVLARLLADCFAPDLVTAIEGEAEVAKAFVRLPFDHLLFTGSTAVGRQVMRAAAENLTPVTLELGGKSPLLLAPDANIASAAASIVYGKFLNAGQTCIAPDYALVPASRLEESIKVLGAEIEKQYPGATDNPDYTAIINEAQFNRLAAYLDEARAAGCRVITAGEQAVRQNRKMPPTLVVDPPEDLRLMQEEIFGPILPILPYDSLDDAVRQINERPKPLALYLYTRSSQIVDDVLRRTASGGVSINDTLMHIAVEDLPFGGVGPSGLGHYHGRTGFDTFSKLKPVFERRSFALSAALRPPYGRLHELVMSFLIRRWK